MEEVEMRILGGRLQMWGSKWSLELYIAGWRPELARLFRAAPIKGLTGLETRIRLEGIRPLVEFEVRPDTTEALKGYNI